MIAECPNCQLKRDLAPSRARRNPLCRRCNILLKAQPLGDLATAGRKSEMGKLGYARTVELHGKGLADRAAREYRLNHPSKPEQAFMAALSVLGITNYERERVLTTAKHSYVYDFYIWTGKDFYYVEVDGVYYHQFKQAYDARKTRLVERRGENLLRFTDKDVLAKDFIARLQAILGL